MKRTVMGAIILSVALVGTSCGKVKKKSKKGNPTQNPAPTLTEQVKTKLLDKDNKDGSALRAALRSLKHDKEVLAELEKLVKDEKVHAQLCPKSKDAASQAQDIELYWDVKKDKTYEISKLACSNKAEETKLEKFDYVESLKAEVDTQAKCDTAAACAKKVAGHSSFEGLKFDWIKDQTVAILKSLPEDRKTALNGSITSAHPENSIFLIGNELAELHLEGNELAAAKGIKAATEATLSYTAVFAADGADLAEKLKSAIEKIVISATPGKLAEVTKAANAYLKDQGAYLDTAFATDDAEASKAKTGLDHVRTYKFENVGTTGIKVTITPAQ